MNVYDILIPLRGKQVLVIHSNGKADIGGTLGRGAVNWTVRNGERSLLFKDEDVLKVEHNFHEDKVPHVITLR